MNVSLRFLPFIRNQRNPDIAETLVCAQDEQEEIFSIIELFMGVSLRFLPFSKNQRNLDIAETLVFAKKILGETYE